jgi:hypothetical protein
LPVAASIKTPFTEELPISSPNSVADIVVFPIRCRGEAKVTPGFQSSKRKILGETESTGKKVYDDDSQIDVT